VCVSWWAVWQLSASPPWPWVCHGSLWCVTACPPVLTAPPTPCRECWCQTPTTSGAESLSPSPPMPRTRHARASTHTHTRTHTNTHTHTHTHTQPHVTHPFPHINKPDRSKLNR